MNSPHLGHESSKPGPNLNLKTKVHAQAQPTRTRRQKVEDREHAIITAASVMFNDKGYAKTTIADIAAASGMADGTVYLYFKNKEALANSVLANFYNDLTIAAQSGVDALSTPRERIRFLAHHHLTQVISHWRILEILPLINMSMETYSGSDLYHMNKAYTAVFDRAVKDGQAQGKIPANLPIWIMRDQFYGAMDYGSKTIMMRGSGTSDIDDFADGLTDRIFTSVSVGHSVEDPSMTRWEDTLTRLEAVAKKIEDKANKE